MYLFLLYCHSDCLLFCCKKQMHPIHFVYGDITFWRPIPGILSLEVEYLSTFVLNKK
jgi:hypothetical protein